jgi:hypothetical protein
MVNYWDQRRLDQVETEKTGLSKKKRQEQELRKKLKKLMKIR